MRNQRKSLRLKEWDYRSAGPYFVTLCALKRNEAFANETIRNSIADIIRVVGADLSARIHSVVVATDHIHLLVTLPQGKTVALPKIIALIKVRITQFLLRAGKPAPTIWQRSYYDHVIRNEKDFLQKAQYIENHTYKEIGTGCAEWH